MLRAREPEFRTANDKEMENGAWLIRFCTVDLVMRNDNGLYLEEYCLMILELWHALMVHYKRWSQSHHNSRTYVTIVFLHLYTHLSGRDLVIAANIMHTPYSYPLEIPFSGTVMPPKCIRSEMC